MPENDPSQGGDQPIPKFRLNAHVFQILGLLAVALALPITMLILALSDMRGKGPKSSPVESPGPAPEIEVSGLRQSLESIAEANLPTGSLETSMRIFRLEDKNANQRDQKARQVLEFLGQSKLGFIESGDTAKPVWTLTVPPGKVSDIEKQLREMGFSDDKNGEGNNPANSDAVNSQSVIYRIYLESGL